MYAPASEHSRSNAPSRSVSRPSRRCGIRLISDLPALVSKNAVFRGRPDVARAERVHANAVAGPFQRRCPSHLHETGLGNGIGRDTARDPDAEDRRDVDDGAAPLRLPQRPCRRLGDQEGALEVGVEDLVPFGLVKVDGKGGRGEPALLTTMSKAVSRKSEVTLSRSITSSSAALARPPSASISATTSESASARRAATVTSAPARARTREVSAEATRPARHQRALSVQIDLHRDPARVNTQLAVIPPTPQPGADLAHDTAPEQEDAEDEHGALNDRRD